MDREEEVSGGGTGRRRERRVGGQSGDETEARGDGRDVRRERSVVSDRKLPAPRAGEGRWKGRRERAGGPRLSLSPPPPLAEGLQGSLGGSQGHGSASSETGTQTYLGTREHSGAPGNAWGAGHGKRQAGHAKPDRLGVSEEPCQEGGASGYTVPLPLVLTPPRASSHEEAHFTDGPLTPSVATCVCGARARPGGRRSLMRGRGPAAHLDALNALGDDVGVVHGHQRDLDAGHPAHGARPHSCKQSAGSSALPASGGGCQPGGHRAPPGHTCPPQARAGLGSSQGGPQEAEGTPSHLHN